MAGDRGPADREVRSDRARRELLVAHELEHATADGIGDGGGCLHNA
jgi:hypothetical protein